MLDAHLKQTLKLTQTTPASASTRIYFQQGKDGEEGTWYCKVPPYFRPNMSFQKPLSSGVSPWENYPEGPEQTDGNLKDSAMLHPNFLPKSLTKAQFQELNTEEQLIEAMCNQGDVSFMFTPSMDELYSMAREIGKNELPGRLTMDRNPAGEWLEKELTRNIQGTVTLGETSFKDVMWPYTLGFALRKKSNSNKHTIDSGLNNEKAQYRRWQKDLHGGEV